MHENDTSDRKKTTIGTRIRDWTAFGTALVGAAIAVSAYLQTRQNSEQLRSNEENTRRIEVAQLLFEAFDLMGADQGVVLGEIRRMPKERNDLQLAIRKIEQALILDEFVDSALAAEGLPILCVPARSGFSAQELAGASRRAL